MDTPVAAAVSYCKFLLQSFCCFLPLTKQRKVFAVMLQPCCIYLLKQILNFIPSRSCDIENVIKNQYFSRYCIAVNNSSIVTNLCYNIGISSHRPNHPSQVALKHHYTHQYYCCVINIHYFSLPMQSIKCQISEKCSS